MQLPGIYTFNNEMCSVQISTEIINYSCSLAIQEQLMLHCERKINAIVHNPPVCHTMHHMWS